VTVLHDEVFSRIPDKRIRVYAVWQPILSSDSADALAESTAPLAQDSRVLQYWDPHAQIGRLFSRALNLPMKTPAWDVYLLYAPETRWESEVPLPAFWMHQLGFPPWSDAAKRLGNQRLDGTKFREAVEHLLQNLKSEAAPEPPPASRGYLRSPDAAEAKALVWSWTMRQPSGNFRTMSVKTPPG
jgi:hypothetical protein